MLKFGGGGIGNLLHIFELQQSLVQGCLLTLSLSKSDFDRTWLHGLSPHSAPKGREELRLSRALEASPLCSKVALADSVEDPLEASPLCSEVALAGPFKDAMEAVALADSVEDRF